MSSAIYFMQQALALAEQARFLAPPNPWVGCVIIKENCLMGSGFTQAPGQAHAEVCALKQAQGKTQGATLYVTLEPCAHTGRTPPCVDAIIQAGIKTVYIAQRDLDPKVNGKGVALLQQAGIEVIEGICQEAAQQALAPYLYQRQTGLPYTVLKTACSLDGRMAAADYTSQWITPVEARQEAHLQRAASQAVVIGSGTALKDRPRLTVRHPLYALARQPLRVLLDTQGRVPVEGPLFDLQLASTLVVTTAKASVAQRKQWDNAHVEVVVVEAAAEGVNLQETWQILGQRQILQVLVEGGPTLQTSLLKQKIVNRLSLYLGPLLLGSNGLSFYQASVSTLTQALRLTLKQTQVIGDCVRLDYEPVY